MVERFILTKCVVTNIFTPWNIAASSKNQNILCAETVWSSVHTVPI